MDVTENENAARCFERGEKSRKKINYYWEGVRELLQIVFEHVQTGLLSSQASTWTHQTPSLRMLEVGERVEGKCLNKKRYEPSRTQVMIPPSTPTEMTNSCNSVALFSHHAMKLGQPSP
ncbi:hypothetical protein GE061_018979 [Apolygus lucorum]|uniref:Uncharacterized protein n=1 Tax=Apolygus lucorum TaxID=248454 RepID=A0A6A4JWY6_APOLU|nr:hypothetical protein GE061_018979 [Apolygus lucorum]